MGIFKIDIEVEKSIIIDSTLEKVWEYISEIKNKNIWSPWLILEKDCKHKTFWNPWTIWYKEHWKWNMIWEWEQIITNINHLQYITYDLNFIKPFKSNNTASFHLTKLTEKQVELTWRMDWSFPLYLFFLRKKTVSYLEHDFERWLIMLKELIEKWKLETETKYIWVDKLNKKYYIWSKWSCKLGELWSKLSIDFTSFGDIINEHKIKSLCYFVRYLKTDMVNDYYEFEACVEIPEADYKNFQTALISTYTLWILDETKVAITSHYGSFKFIPNSWTWAYMYVKYNKLEINKSYSPIELYESWINDWVKEKDFVVHVLIPVK